MMASLRSLLQAELEQLATTRRPSTMTLYRAAARRFVDFLSVSFPHLQRLSELRRDPHLTAFLQHLCQRQPAWSKKTRYNYLVCLRRLLDDLAGRAIDPAPADLLRWSDVPRLDLYLPRPLSIEDDGLLSAHLSASHDLTGAALLLIRATGMRIGECLDLTTQALLHPDVDCWAIHVPLGKLHTERWVPIDAPTRAVFLRLLELRRACPSAAASPYLLPRPASRGVWYERLRLALRTAARQAGCSTDRITPHQLRHSMATQMVRAGMSLPALMQLLGHHDIRMTLRYVQVTQADLQREFQLARQRLASIHHVPSLPIPAIPAAAPLPLAAVRDALLVTRRLLESYRRDIQDSQRKTLDRLANRMAKLAQELERLLTTKVGID